jgi:GH25 family lysozyme M1 (1,4-beta-N-acetylmuramidase)
MLKGIDVSNNNGTIDWRAVAGSGVSFAFLKATEGTSFVDSTYATNRNAAKKQGIKVGAYHFARPGKSQPGQQAEHFLAHAQPQQGDLYPVLDLEDNGGLGPADVQRWARGWLDAVERSVGVKPIIYTSPSFWHDRVGNADFSGNALWHAQYTKRPTADVAGAWKAYAIWQHADDGSIAGISGHCDLNRCEDDALDAITIGQTAGPKLPELSPGMRRAEVAELKRALTAYFREHPEQTTAKWTQDTVYGPQAVLAVKDFQRAHGLDPDGVVGPLTWQAIANETAELQLSSRPQ